MSEGDLFTAITGQTASDPVELALNASTPFKRQESFPPHAKRVATEQSLAEDELRLASRRARTMILRQK